MSINNDELIMKKNEMVRVSAMTDADYGVIPPFYVCAGTKGRAGLPYYVHQCVGLGQIE